MLRKKAATMEFLMKILLVIIAFMIILGAIKMFASKADVDSGLSICRGSLALKENSKIGFDSDSTFSAYSMDISPLLCKTYDLKLPEGKYERDLDKTKEAVLNNIADRIADCWWQFGEGMIDENVFGKQLFGFTSKNRCFNCFTFSINEMKNADEITIEELYDYMASHPYTASADDRPFCVGEEGEIPGEGGNCIDKNLPECERKGGICAEDYYIGEYSEFEKWSCPKKEKCFVDNKNLLTYMEYIYFSRGEGVISIHDSVGSFNLDESYAIAFISQTHDFGWEVVDVASWFIPLPGASLAVKGGSKLLGVLAKAGIGKIGKIIGTKSSEIAFRGMAMGVESGIVKGGTVISKSKLGTRLVQGAVVNAGSEIGEQGTDLVNNFFSGTPQIVMIAPLNEINDICITQDEVGQK